MVWHKGQIPQQQGDDPSVMKTSMEFKVPVLVKEHSHPADHTAVDMEQCRQSMKRIACSTNDKPNQILVHILSDIRVQSFILDLIELASTVQYDSIIATCVQHWVTNGNLRNNLNNIGLTRQTVSYEFDKPLL